MPRRRHDALGRDPARVVGRVRKRGAYDPCKAETRQALKSGELIPAGETEGTKDERAAASPQHFTKTRAQGEAEERADAKAGKLIPAGEGQTAPTK